ncbi:MAG: tRNA lysidine(34) synthetase TilS [Lachnospiraceae bacterium]|nr:tRNA lysidine(34) synthetase TilS [Lachnospiraceae bacterium]
MTIRNKIIDFCNEKKLLDSGDGVIIGLSGGADSVCLLFMLSSMQKELNLKLCAVHVNHGIRGSEADRDEAFCKRLCEKFDVPFEAVRADIPALAEKDGLGLEEAGRKFRYAFFEKKADEMGFNKIAVAHHMNDRAETVLFQLVRGSKLNGLSGIREKNGRIIRPLLCLTREEIELCLKMNGLDFVTDSTNLSSDYTRNYIRNEILPGLEKLRPHAGEHIAETADYLERVSEFMEKAAQEVYDACVSAEPSKPGSLRMSVNGLKNAEPLLSEMVIYKAICLVAGRKKDITEKFVLMVKELCDKQSGRSVDLKYGVVAKRIYDNILILRETRENAVDSEDVNCNNVFCTVISVNEGENALDLIENLGGFPKDNLKKFFDCDKLLSRFNIRSAEEEIVGRKADAADLMAVYPDGRRKKVFDILKDEKIEADERKNFSVAAIGREVLMIKGVRSCEICRVDEKTKNILSVSFGIQDTEA